MVMSGKVKYCHTNSNFNSNCTIASLKLKLKLKPWYLQSDVAKLQCRLKMIFSVRAGD